MCMIYSSGLPLLYIITLLFLCTLYCLDKCYLLRSYKNPLSVDNRMDTQTIRFLRFVIPIHIMFSMYTYGNSYFFEDDDT